ncbi:hypothetical protein V6C27_03100 [Peptococcaceae bacterium 1198_IL3148]
MRKVILILILAFLTLGVLVGCGGSDPDELKDIATKENVWLEQLQPIASNITNSYEKWEAGELSREQLANELAKNIEEVQDLRSQSDQYYLNEIELTEEIKKHPDYDQGLYYGQSLRLNVYTFLIAATQGYQVAPSDTLKNKEPVTDQELKSTFDTEMVTGYERKVDKLKTALGNQLN